MANYLLVHGAWGGAWYWRPVQHALIRAGHNAHAVTLTGLGERAHLLSPAITLGTHIADVRQALAAEELSDCILVVHSYAGMLGTAVADREPPTLRHLCMSMPGAQAGRCWSGTHASGTRRERLRAAEISPPTARRRPGCWPVAATTPGGAAPGAAPRPPTGPLELTRAVARVPRTFIDCTQPKLATIDVIRQRVRDPAFWDGAWLPGSRIVEMATGHDPMISETEAMTRLLLELA